MPISELEDLILHIPQIPGPSGDCNGNSSQNGLLGGCSVRRQIAVMELLHRWKPLNAKVNVTGDFITGHVMLEERKQAFVIDSLQEDYSPFLCKYL